MKIYFPLFLLACAIAYGCNSAMIYETEKVSLTLESRADVSQPIAGNLGIKQRVAMIIPGKEAQITEVEEIRGAQPPPESTSDGENAKGAKNSAITKSGEEDSPKITPSELVSAPPVPNNEQTGSGGWVGEAVSVLSYFDFHLNAEPGFNNDEVTIDTVLLAGAAAAELNDKNGDAAEIFKEISSPSEDPKLNQVKIANFALMYDGIVAMSSKGDAQASFHKQALDLLHIYVPDQYEFSLYRATGPGDYRVAPGVQKGNNVAKNNVFTDVTGYLGKMNEAILNIDTMTNTAGLKIDGNPVSPEEVVKNGLRTERSAVEKMLNKKLGVRKHSAVVAAMDYYIKTLKE